MKIPRLITMMVVILFIGACTMPVMQPEKDASVKDSVPVKDLTSINDSSETLIRGEIDSLKQVEVIFSSEEIIITLLGFKSGSGIILLGIHPGLKEGKKVKIRVKSVPNKVYKGTSIYEALQIDEDKGL